MRKPIMVPALIVALGVLGGVLGIGSTGVAKADSVCVGIGPVQVDVNCYRQNDWRGDSWRGDDWNRGPGNCWDRCGGQNWRPPSPPGNWNWDGWNWIPPFPPPWSDPWTQWYWDGWNWCRV